MADYNLVITRNKLQTFFQKSELELKRYVANYLLTFYKKNKINHTNDYVYAKGDIPVLLVAHLDTVHKARPINILYDSALNQAWSEQGIGGDDRNGVLAIFEILTAGYRPYVLFTTGEERGGIGASAFVRNKPNLPVKYMVEIDRTGSNDAVFYSCGNEDFMKYILDITGYKEQWGSYTDIETIMPIYDIAGVNLSCGYYNAHMKTEFVDFNELEVTILTIMGLLNDAENAEYFDMQEIQYRGYKGYSTSTWDNFGKCTGCGKWKQLTVWGTEELCNDCLIDYYATKSDADDYYYDEDDYSTSADYYYLPSDNLLFTSMKKFEEYIAYQYLVVTEDEIELFKMACDVRELSNSEMWKIFEGGAVFWTTN